VFPTRVRIPRRPLGRVVGRDARNIGTALRLDGAPGRKRPHPLLTVGVPFWPRLRMAQPATMAMLVDLVRPERAGTCDEHLFHRFDIGISIGSIGFGALSEVVGLGRCGTWRSVGPPWQCLDCYCQSTRLTRYSKRYLTALRLSVILAATRLCFLTEEDYARSWYKGATHGRVQQPPAHPGGHRRVGSRR